MAEEPNRAAIRSLAYKIANSRSAVEKAKKELTEDWRRQTAEVNARAKDAMLFGRLREFDVPEVLLDLSAEQVRTVIDRMDAIQIDDTWQEARSAAERIADALMAGAVPHMEFRP